MLQPINPNRTLFASYQSYADMPVT